MRTHDDRLQERLLRWGSRIPDLRPDHLRDGLYVALGTCGDDSSEDAVFLVAADISFWYWIDDLSDLSLTKSQSAVHWDSMLQCLSLSEAQVMSTDVPPEVAVLGDLRALVRNTALSDDEGRYWCSTAASTLRGMRFEEEVSRGTRRVGSFVECLEHGTNSISVQNILATVLIAQRRRHSEFWYDERPSRLTRLLASLQRVVNDLFSAEKERKEGTSGRLSNSVLYLEQSRSSEFAYEFVKECRIGYRDLVQQEIAALGPNHPVGMACQRMLECIDAYYQDRPARYRP